MLEKTTRTLNSTNLLMGQQRGDHMEGATIAAGHCVRILRTDTSLAREEHEIYGNVISRNAFEWHPPRAPLPSQTSGPGTSQPRHQGTRLTIRRTGLVSATS